MPLLTVYLPDHNKHGRVYNISCNTFCVYIHEAHNS